MNKLVQQIEQDGYAIVPPVVNEQSVTEILKDVEDAAHNEKILTRGQSIFGIRNLLDVVPTLKTVAESETLRTLIDPIVGKSAKAVRAIYFDKNQYANWKVAWHQDQSIAVRERKDVEGFDTWTIKAGIVNVQPPVSVLENILTVRIHLDVTDSTNGALKVIPGSHRYGRLTPADIQRWKEKANKITCEIARGGVLLMRPLLLHASSASEQPLHRRVLHFEYSSLRLPGGLEWYGS